MLANAAQMKGEKKATLLFFKTHAYISICQGDR